MVVIDGMQGGTAATQQVFIEHAGIPTLAALPLAVEALDEMNVLGEVQLIISGGIRTGADVAKALGPRGRRRFDRAGRVDGLGLQSARLSNA